MKLNINLLKIITISLLCLMFLGCSEEDNVTGGGGGDEGDVEIQERRAYFSNTEVVWNTQHEMIWIESDLNIIRYAYKDRITVGGYWYRKGKDGKYYYVTTSCDKNVPDNILGHQFLTPIPDDNVFINNQQYGAVHFSCFPDRTGQYYGKIKLHNSKSVGINPNSPTITYSKMVSFSWGNCDGNSSGKSAPIIKILSEEEEKDIENHLQCVKTKTQ